MTSLFLSMTSKTKFYHTTQVRLQIQSKFCNYGISIRKVIITLVFVRLWPKKDSLVNMGDEGAMERINNWKPPSQHFVLFPKYTVSKMRHWLCLKTFSFLAFVYRTNFLKVFRTISPFCCNTIPTYLIFTNNTINNKITLTETS